MRSAIVVVAAVAALLAFKVAVIWTDGFSGWPIVQAAGLALAVIFVAGCVALAIWQSRQRAKMTPERRREIDEYAAREGQIW